jgi:long-chain acyl-CoA synthetase
VEGTLGYWNDPENTKLALRGGGMHTGDLAWCDADGFLWFAGRSKDIIIRGGSNISPGEGEDVLYTHPAVYEAGVVGVPCSEMGQRVRAYVAKSASTFFRCRCALSISIARSTFSLRVRVDQRYLSLAPTSPLRSSLSAAAQASVSPRNKTAIAAFRP